RLLAQVRRAGIAAEIYPEAVKMKKQFDYAQKRGILYMVFVGESEIASRTATVKNIVTGQQENVPFDQLAEHLR
ncbi:His/Gly/Thr/Pro-type tRNA ligase C-terminal domain-containing protein, partial [Millionella massiliensis]|uniref:His/Gly/Thr/Pro-type tRNA ligase C-terminal domain-containing protein n=1 Tax=Millionella massiliensis TaxID=1871023 RepID=UPI0023A8F80B